MTTGAAPLTPPTTRPRVADLVVHRPRGRRLVDGVMRGLALAATVIVLVPLAAVIAYVVVNGWPWLDREFLTSPPVDNVNGGALSAVLGTLQMVPLAALLAAPVGILGGIFVAEIAPPRVATGVRFAADVMVGLPSVVIGVFCYAILVVPFKTYSSAAGIVALAIIMIPIILRNTEEILRLVPPAVREGGLALGMPRWRTTTVVVIRAGFGGIVTGVILAVARAAGETAPLLLTALGSRLVNVGELGKPMDSLPTFIYVNSGQPSPVLVGQAWAAALILVMLVLVANIVARVLAARRTSGRS